MIEVEQNKHAKRLLMAARKLGEGWLQAPDHQDMRVQLQALFSEDYFDALMAAEFPLFLGQKLEGLDRQAGDEFVDEAYERGLMLSDGAAVPLLRRLRGIRLDVLRELAIYCDCPKLAKMIDDLETEVQTAQATAGSEMEIKPIQRGQAQAAAILETIQKMGHDPLRLPKNPDGKQGVKAEVRKALERNPLFAGKTVFDKAWERLSRVGDIVIAKVSP